MTSKKDVDPLNGIDPNRIKEWEARGVDAIEADLKYRSGLTYVGSQDAVDWAWRWVRYKRDQEKEKPEVLSLKPNIHGIGIDLKAAGKRLWRKPRDKK